MHSLILFSYPPLFLFLTRKANPYLACLKEQDDEQTPKCCKYLFFLILLFSKPIRQYVFERFGILPSISCLVSGAHLSKWSPERFFFGERKTRKGNKQDSPNFCFSLLSRIKSFGLAIELQSTSLSCMKYPLDFHGFWYFASFASFLPFLSLIPLSALLTISASRN